MIRRSSSQGHYKQGCKDSLREHCNIIGSWWHSRNCVWSNHWHGNSSISNSAIWCDTIQSMVKGIHTDRDTSTSLHCNVAAPHKDTDCTCTRSQGSLEHTKHINQLRFRRLMESRVTGLTFCFIRRAGHPSCATYCIKTKWHSAKSFQNLRQTLTKSKSR